MILPRRQFLTGLASLIAAPAVVRASSLMAVRAIITPPVYELRESSLETIYIEISRRRTGMLIRSMRQTRLIVAANMMRELYGTEGQS